MIKNLSRFILPGIMLLAPAFVSAERLETVDRALVNALQAPDESGRKQFMQQAQNALDGFDALPAVDDQSDPLDDAVVARAEQQTAVELRETLLQGVWRSPYGGVPKEGLDLVHHVSDVLRVLRAASNLEIGDSQALEVMRHTYRQWMEARADSLGMDAIAIAADTSATVLDQRVMRKDDGAAVIYQLRGHSDGTIHWQALPTEPVPEGLLTAAAMRVSPEQETAPWMLIVEGENLEAVLVAHRHWLAAIARPVRLVLRERGGIRALGRVLASEALADLDRYPYVMMNGGSQPARVTLIRTKPAAVVAHWPLDVLEGTHAHAFKTFINRIVAAGG